MHIEPMQDQDIVEVSNLLRACFAWLCDVEGFGEGPRAFLTGERSSAQTVRQEARTRPHLVARIDGTVAGVAAVDGNRLARLYVHPEYHRRGVGRELFRAAEELIEAAGHDQMNVGALVESAIAFYRSMGMHITGTAEYEPELFPNGVTLLAKTLRR